MEVENGRKDKSFFFKLFCCNNLTPSSTMAPPSPGEQLGLVPSDSTPKSKPGWKAMPYIIGNETIERIATYGTAANFNVFLRNKFNMGQVGAANVINIWGGASNCIPIFGAIVADSYLGKFTTIASASFATLLGIVILILIVWIPQLHPPTCASQPQQEACTPPTTLQLGILILSLSWLSIGTGGIRPCSIPFAIDQFDTSSPQGRKGVRRFYNWYYTTQTLVLLFNMTLMVYVQNKNWVLGFGLLALLMSCAIMLFFVGTRVYCYAPPQGSLLSEIAQVFVAAYRKRGLRDPASVEEEPGVFYYDPPLKANRTLKMPLTKHLKRLNKAAMVRENELNSEGLAANSWRLCSIQQVEEAKCLMKLIPIWASGIFSMIAVYQQGTFPVSQAMTMNRHLAHHFKIPPASIGVVPLVTIGIWLPCYDFFIQSALAKITKREEGITSLQKIVIGNIFAVLTMVTAGVIEGRRRVAATADGGGAAMSVLWLAPQLVFLGFSEVFSIIGQIEFYNGESPEHMKSIGNSLVFLGGAFSNCAATLVMNVVHGVTRNHGTAGWLADDINRGRLDYYYFLIAGLASLNLVYLVACVKRYRYKALAKAQVLDTP